MTTWHTITSIGENAYQISEPIGIIEPRFGVSTVNMYLVVGREQAALIDSGMGIGDVFAEIAKITSLPCMVLNTHYHWDEPYVTNTSSLIMEKWRKIAADLPTILMGDFNLPPTSDTHKLFCGESITSDLNGEFVDPWIMFEKSEQDEGTYNDFTGDKSGDRIDWILVTPRFKVNDIQIIHDNINNKYPSDHFPVVAILKL